MTKAILLGIAAVGIVTFFSKPSIPNSAYYEADSKGRLERIERPSQVRASLPPLWKPEPELLIRQAGGLRLSSKQMVMISAVEKDWKSIKTDLEERMKSTVPIPEKPAKLSLAALQADLSSYSMLSLEYDRQRDRHWSAAVALLSPDQAKKIKKEASR